MKEVSKQLAIGAFTIVLAWALIEGIKYARSHWRLSQMAKVPPAPAPDAGDEQAQA